MGSSRVSFAASLLVAVVSGCSTVGPSAIRGGRTAYNDAIVSTGNEQVLSLIVRHRYAENAQLLGVSSVTANMRVSARVGAEFGLGPNSNFSGNLVPLSTSILVEENPTIAYVPLAGEQFIRELLAPIPLDLAMLLLADDYESAKIFELLIERVSILQDAAAARTVDSAEFARLLGELQLHGSARWVNAPTQERAVVIRWGEAGEQFAQELAANLGLQYPSDRVLRLRVADSTAEAVPGDLVLNTRSIGDLVRVGGAAMDVPSEHIESGLAMTVPAVLAPRSHIAIQGSRSRPSDPYVAVELHGRWYWIASTDIHTKRFFKLLTTLISVRLSDSIRGNSQGPVLTIPTTR